MARGTVTITDFNDKEGDKISLRDFGIGFEDVMDFAQNEGNDCHIQLGSKEIILRNVNTLNLHESWFTPVPSEVLARSTPNFFLDNIHFILLGLIGVGTFMHGSYEYYKPGVLGHDKFYSYASSFVPEFVMRTTANIISKAEADINKAEVLEAEYAKVSDDLLEHQHQLELLEGEYSFFSHAPSWIPEFIKKTTDNLVKAVVKMDAELGIEMYTENINSLEPKIEQALLQAEQSCREAAFEATLVRNAAQAILSTATGRAEGEALEIYNTAGAAIERYTALYTEYNEALMPDSAYTPG